MINEIKRRLDLGQEVQLECTDVFGFIHRDYGMYATANREIINSSLIVTGTYSGSLKIKNCKHGISKNEYCYFKIKEKQEQDMSYSEKLINKDEKFQEMLVVASNAVDKGVLSCFTVNDMDCSDMIGNGLYLGLNMTYHAIENEIKGIEKMMDENKAVEQEAKEPAFDDLIDVVVKAYRNRLLDIFLMNDEVITVFNYDDTGTKEGINRADTRKYYQFINFINSLYTESFVIDKECLMPKVKDEAKVTLSNGNSFIARKVEHGFVAMQDGSEVKSLMFKDHNDFWVTYSFFELKGATVTQQKGNK